MVSAATGNSITKRLPTGLFSSTRMEPLWSSTILLTMARPSPVPRCLVEKYGRNNRSFTSRETPCPVSETTSSTASRLATSAVEIVISFNIESCMASAALSIRLATARLIASGSAITAGKSCAKSSVHANAFQPSAEQAKRALDQIVQAGRLRTRRGEARQHGEFVDQVSHRLDSGVDGIRAGANYFNGSCVGR